MRMRSSAVHLVTVANGDRGCEKSWPCDGASSVAPETPGSIADDAGRRG